MKKIVLALILIVSGLSATEVSDFIDKSKCDKDINKGTYNICYSYKYKGAIGGWTTLDERAASDGIKDRPKFYDELTIPKEYRTTYSDYTGFANDWNRGHFIVADADLDDNYDRLLTSYSMANIIPQSASVNQKTWLKMEKYGRMVASKLGELHSISIAKYNDPNLKLRDITIPTDLYRIYYNDAQNFKKCFHYKNELNVDVVNDELRDHEIDCKQLEL